MKMTPQPPTYPARPLNGGALDVALPKRGEWRAEPKYNGWRALVHVPTGAMFNRHLERLSIESEFRQPLAALRTRFSSLEWADCEALSRRHALGRHSLILLDLVEPYPYTARRRLLNASGIVTLATDMRPANDALYLPPSYSVLLDAWDSAKAANEILGCDFYEGIVAKRADSLYPIQRISASRETADWIKHRWRQ